MDSESLRQAIDISRAALKQAEERFGPDHPAVAKQLDEYAHVLRQTPDGLLTAINLEARARLIRQQNPEPVPLPLAFNGETSATYDLIELWIPNKTFFAQAQKWCQGQSWLPRLALLCLFGFIFIRHLQDSLYQSIFKPLDLGLHELGHMLFNPFGMFIGVFGGSFFQCLVPAGAVLMFYRQRDFFAIAVAFGWLSTNFFDVATYIADARAQELPLVSPFKGGEPIHDWNYLLSELHMLRFDTMIASCVRGWAVLSMLICLGFGSWLIYTILRCRKPELRNPNQ